MAKTLDIGTVSHGTMQPRDLIPAFLDALEDVDKTRHDAFYATIETTDDETWDEYCERTEDADEIVNELFDVLGEYTPDFCYFGAIEGDGSDYGCWISWDSVAEGEHDGEILRDRDQADDTSNEAPYFLDVSDHGNATLYARKRSADGVELVELWGVV